MRTANRAHKIKEHNKLELEEEIAKQTQSCATGFGRCRYMSVVKKINNTNMGNPRGVLCCTFGVQSWGLEIRLNPLRDLGRIRGLH